MRPENADQVGEFAWNLEQTKLLRNDSMGAWDFIDAEEKLIEMVSDRLKSSIIASLRKSTFWKENYSVSNSICEYLY